jgi:hypothetical protein
VPLDVNAVAYHARVAAELPICDLEAARDARIARLDLHDRRDPVPVIGSQGLVVVKPARAKGNIRSRAGHAVGPGEFEQRRAVGVLVTGDDLDDHRLGAREIRGEVPCSHGPPFVIFVLGRQAVAAPPQADEDCRLACGGGRRLR